MNTVSEPMATLGSNSELDINLVASFLTYGLIQDENSGYHIDGCHSNCLLQDWKVVLEDYEG
jgi:hypothetical protein